MFRASKNQEEREKGFGRLVRIHGVMDRDEVGMSL